MQPDDSWPTWLRAAVERCAVVLIDGQVGRLLHVGRYSRTAKVYIGGRHERIGLAQVVAIGCPVTNAWREVMPFSDAPDPKQWAKSHPWQAPTHPTRVLAPAPEQVAQSLAALAPTPPLKPGAWTPKHQRDATTPASR